MCMTEGGVDLGVNAYRWSIYSSAHGDEQGARKEG